MSKAFCRARCRVGVHVPRRGAASGVARLLMSILLMAVLFFVSQSSFGASEPKGGGEAIPLNVGWEFRWQAESPCDAPATASMDGEWQRTALPTNPPGRGAEGTLWARVQIPRLPWSEPVIYLLNVDQIVSVYLDGARVYQFGECDGANRIVFPGFVSHFIPVPKEAEGKHLLFRFRSEHMNVGVAGIPQLGSHREIQREIFVHDLDRLVLGCVNILLGLFMAFLITRQRQEKAYASFAVFTVCMGIYVLMRTEAKHLIFDAPVTFFMLEI